MCEGNLVWLDIEEGVMLHREGAGDEQVEARLTRKESSLCAGGESLEV